MKNLNKAQGAKAVEMAVILGQGKEVTNKPAEKVGEPQQLILLPTLAEAPKAEKKGRKAAAKAAPKAEKNEEPKTEPVKAEEPKAEKAEAAKVAPKAEPKPRKMSIDELTDKAEKVYLLQGKYAEVRAKRKQLQNFTIKHEEETAQLTLVDAKGMNIVTHNPTAIKHLLDDWAKDLDNHLLDIESQLRKELENLA